MGSRILSYFRESVNWLAAMILVLSQLLFPVLAVTRVEAADTGFQVPTALHTPNGWDTVVISDVQSSDDTYAVDTGEDWQGFSNFNFPAIPATDQIDGIEVQVEANSTDNSGCRVEVELSWNGGTSNADQKAGGVSSADSLVTLGGVNDTWGRTWSVADFSNANFVAEVRMDDTSGSNCNNNATASFDLVQAKVYHSPPPPQADLVVVKTNNAQNDQVITSGTFDWTLTVTNQGLGTAVFNNQDILEDDLPNNATYSPTSNIAVTSGGGLTGSVDCDISGGNTLDCDDNNGGDSVTMAPGAWFAVTFNVDPDGPSTLDNPRSGGSNRCMADPDNVISEENERNNQCSDSVSVVELPAAPNPALSQACGLDIALVLDNSTSISSTEMIAMKNAMTAFVNALDGTPTEFSVSRFATSGAVLQTFTDDTAAVNAAINSVPVGGGFTNWEDGLDKAQSTLSNRVNPDLVVFASDGDPTTSTTVGGTDTNQPNAHLEPAVVEANSIKNSGARVLAIGIGDPTVSRLSAISGPNVNTGNVLTSDVITTDFASLAADLAEFATQTCGGTVTIEKLIDADGNLQTTNDQTPAQGWQFNATGNGLDTSATTDSNGMTQAVEVQPGAGYNLTEVAQPGFGLLQATCQGATGHGDPNANGVAGLNIQANDIVSCTFINAELEGTLVLEKKVKNDNGGTLTQDNFPVSIDDQLASWGSHTLEAGSYTVYKGSQPGYEAGEWGGDCDANGNVTVPAGGTVKCTITNDDIAPTVNLQKHVFNDDGGTALSSSFELFLNGVLQTNPEIVDQPAANNGTLTAYTNRPMTAGAEVTFSETQKFGYEAISSHCFEVTDPQNATPVGTVFTPELGQRYVCTIVNDDIAPRLTVTKVVNDQWNGGLSVSDFPLYVDGNLVVSGVQFEINAGSVVVTEGQQDGYQLVDVAGDCNFGGEITLEIGGVYTCTLFNNDLPAKIKVLKKVVNDDGGNASEANFDLFVNNTQVTHDQWNTFAGNTEYTVSEVVNVTGYEQTNIECADFTDANGRVAIEHPFVAENGRTYVCQITNDDVAPTLQLKKTVVNDNGGNNVASDWTLTAEGQQTTYIDNPGIKGGDTMVLTQRVEVSVGDPITLSESGPSGYSASDWNCDGGNFDNGQLYIGLGENVVCEIVNNDRPARLDIVKVARNDDGGQTEAVDFDLFVNNRSLANNFVTSGSDNPTDTYATYSVPRINSNAAYEVSETAVDGYELESIKCFSVTERQDQPVRHPVTPNEGEHIRCVVFNNDKPARLVLNKRVINDDGGRLEQDKWLLRADGPTLLEGRDQSPTPVGVSGKVSAGWYYLSEIGSDGYELRGIICNGERLQGEPRIYIENGQEVRCTFVNDDIPPTLRLTKRAISVDRPIDQRFRLRANQDGNNFNSPYIVDVNPNTPRPNTAVIDGEDGLDAGWVRVSEVVPENWRLAKIVCHYTQQVDFQATENQDVEANEAETERRTEGVFVKLRPGDDVTCRFINFEKSKVAVTKYWDANQNGEFDEGETTLPDWTFELEHCRDNKDVINAAVQPQGEIKLPPIDYRCERLVDNLVTELDYQYGRTQEGTTGEDGSVMFPGLAPFGHYVLREQFQDGWNISDITCEYPDEKSEGRIFSPNEYHLYMVPGAEVECFVGNYQDGRLEIAKTNNRIGDDLVDGDFVTYTITVTNPLNSGISYETITYDLLPDNIVYSPGSGSATSSERGALTSPLDGTDYIAAGPASWELGDMIPGEVVTLTYTAQVANDTEPGTYENIAWVEGWACQYQGIGYIPAPDYPEQQLRVVSEVTVPELDDDYENGHKNPCPFGGEVECDDVFSALYDDGPCGCDVAYVLDYDEPCYRDTATLPGGFATLVSILGNQVNGEGDPFVESAVTVVAEDEEQGFVLGITTEVRELANTGVAAILPPAVGLALAGLALTLSGGKQRRGTSLFSKIAHGMKHLVVALALVVGFSGSALAATGSGWQLNVVDLPESTSDSTLNIAYQVASVEAGDKFDVELFQDGVSVDSAHVSTAYGDNGSFQVSDLADGTYQFSVVADNTGDAANKTNTQTITVDTKRPTEVVYEGVEQDGNKFTLTFTVPAGSDSDVVNIYASTEKEFVANAQSLVGTVDATPGVEQSFTYEASNDSQRYFALEAVDKAGNASPLVGDSETVVTGGSGSNGVATGNGDATNGATGTGDDGTEVLGEEDDPNAEGNQDSSEDAGDNEDEESDSSRGWIVLGLLALVAAGFVFRQRTAK